MGTKVKAALMGLLLVVAIAALALSRRPSIVLHVHAEETEACTLQTLDGRYGFTGQGFFTGSNTRYRHRSVHSCLLPMSGFLYQTD